MDRSSLIAELENYFHEQREDLVAVYLFGSAARGEMSRGGDVDLGLLLSHEPPAVLSTPARRIEADLEARFRRPVEAVVLNGAPVDLVHRILRDGVLIFEGDASARVRFEVSSRREYLDLAPILQLYRNAVQPARVSKT